MFGRENNLVKLLLMRRDKSHLQGKTSYK